MNTRILFSGKGNICFIIVEYGAYNNNLQSWTMDYSPEYLKNSNSKIC